MHIEKAELIDLPKILDLQKKAYISEAELVNDYSIPPLIQTLQELESEFHNGIVLKAIDEAHIPLIVGSVRGYTHGNTLYIGKLLVDPSYQNKGIGKSLLISIEAYYPNLRYELFTSSKSLKNLSLYMKMGYSEFKRVAVNEDLEFVYLEK